MTDAEAAKAGLEKVTDFVEDKGVDGARASLELNPSWVVILIDNND